MKSRIIKSKALVVSVAMLALALTFSAPSMMAAEQDTTRIEKQVSHELNMLPYGTVFDYLTFTVGPDGTVTLAGDVTRPYEKSDAEKAVKTIAGVERVDNQIKVLPVSLFDTQLRRELYRRIYGYPVLQRYGLGPEGAIRIVVDNGHVTLIGYVDNQADKIIAGMQANSVPGIFSVDNQLKVAKG